MTTIFQRTCWHGPEWVDGKPCAKCAHVKPQEAEHECDESGEVDIDLCTDCGEHAGFCSVCGGSNCCGAGAIQPDQEAM